MPLPVPVPDRTLLALALLALASCGSKASPPPAPRDAAPVAVVAPPADARPAPTSPIPDDALQLVVVATEGWDAASGLMQRWERASATAPWRVVVEDGGRMPVVSLGHAGAAWGRGLHTTHGDGPVKQEGDGRSPAGAFRILRAFGYAAGAPTGATLPYAQVDASWKCVDDPASTRYNDVLDADGVTVDWSSHEEMRRDDALYTWVVEIDHNGASHIADTPAPGGGSCIFFHVWREPLSPTLGCTAMPEAELAAMIAWLQPGAVYVLLPIDEHAALKAAWRLP